MAQNYEIDIKRFNGQDYDILLPTPASHASTHQANGSDPLTLQAGNYGALSIPTSAYQNASVTRAKLAKDALYSPMKGTGTATEYYFVADDLGKTVTCTGTAPSGKATYIMTEEVAASLPSGAEIAVAWTNGTGGVQVRFEGTIKSATMGDSGYVAGRTYNIPERYSMIALKMMGNASPTYWLVTGNAEVV